MKNKKLIKIFIILIILGIGGYVFYLMLPNENDNPSLGDEGSEETFESCSEIEDEDTCNTVEDSVSGNLRCKYDSVYNICETRSVPVTCADPDIVKSEFGAGNSQYTIFYDWTPDDGGSDLFGQGTHRINSSRVQSDYPNPNVIITDFGINPIEYCEWEDYNVPEFKINDNAHCRFSLSFEDYHNARKFPEENVTCGETNTDLFKVTIAADDCNGTVSIQDCSGDNQQNCNNDFCTFGGESGEEFCSLRRTSDSKYICGAKTAIMNSCYWLADSEHCINSNGCNWIAKYSVCLPENYPLDSDDENNYTAFYSIPDVSCMYVPATRMTNCSTNT
jgi:hypothetical protein